MKLLKRSRFNYWSHSKFANCIRGEKKSLYRYWIAGTFLNKLQDIACFPMDVYYTIEVYVRNRFIDKTHYLRTGLKPGEYYDADYRILHGLFNELVIYVESELAHLSNYKSEKRYKFIKGRCKEAGLDYLNWASQLVMNEEYGIAKDDPDYGKLSTQAIQSKKILELYNWWNNRPKRINPHELFTREIFGKNCYKLIQELEDRYDKEDTDMLVELVKIRGSLWT